jgi:HAD superfamily hydrolase (TIGR01509 family)
MAQALVAMIANSIRGFIFDMDGVIVDSHPAHRRAWKSFLRSVCRHTTDEELNFILDGRKREEILKHFLGDLSEEEMRDYGSRKDEMLRRLGNGARPVGGVVSFLASLRSAGLRAAVATTAGRTRTMGTLAELGLTGWFDAIVTGDEVLTGKPDPCIYRLATERIQEDPEHLLAVEDAVSGVQAARKAACVVWESQPHHSRRNCVRPGRSRSFPISWHCRFRICRVDFVRPSCYPDNKHPLTAL